MLCTFWTSYLTTAFFVCLLSSSNAMPIVVMVYLQDNCLEIWLNVRTWWLQTFFSQKIPLYTLSPSKLFFVSSSPQTETLLMGWIRFEGHRRFKFISSICTFPDIEFCAHWISMGSLDNNFIEANRLSQSNFCLGLRYDCINNTR
jgi:hypothetical protein